MTSIKLPNLTFDTITVFDYSGNKQEYNLRDELSINEFNLIGDIQNQSANYVFWSSMYARVKQQVDSKKIECERVDAYLYKLCRVELIESGIAKPTQSQIDAEVNSREEHFNAYNQLAELQSVEEQLKYAVRAWEQRKDMLVQMKKEETLNKEYEKAIKNI